MPISMSTTAGFVSNPATSRCRIAATSWQPSDSDCSTAARNRSRLPFPYGHSKRDADPLDSTSPSRCSVLPDRELPAGAPSGCAGSIRLPPHAALFVAACRVAELALKTPVRTEGDEAAGLLPLVSSPGPSSLRSSGCHSAAVGRLHRNSETPARELLEKPAGLRASRPGDTRPHWPSIASRRPGAWSARRSTLPRLRTNLPALPRPDRNSAARTLRVLPVPVVAADGRRNCAPSVHIR